MIPKRETDRGVDELLREALGDDLPAEVAAGMRERIDRFRAGKTRERDSPRTAGTGAWLFRRTVWAALSILLLVAGILLQGARASSPLADRISAIKTANLSLEQIRR
jgi:hypothetical protein